MIRGALQLRPCGQLWVKEMVCKGGNSVVGSLECLWEQGRRVGLSQGSSVPFFLTPSSGSFPFLYTLFFFASLQPLYAFLPDSQGLQSLHLIGEGIGSMVAGYGAVSRLNFGDKR